MKKSVSLLLLFLLFSCNANINENNQNNNKTNVNKNLDIVKNNCKIKFETIQKDIIEFNFDDKKCNYGNNDIKSQEVKLNDITGNYNESEIKLDRYDLIIKQDKILYSSFGAYNKSLFKDVIDLGNLHKINLELLAIYNFDSLGLTDEEISKKDENNNITNYVLSANIGNINIVGIIAKEKEGEIKEIYEKMKKDLNNTKIIKETLLDNSGFDENGFILFTNFGEYKTKVNIIDYKYDKEEAYNFSTMEGICTPNAENVGCKIYKFENNEIYWGNELIDKNTGEDYKININLKTDLLTGNTFMLDN